MIHLHGHSSYSFLDGFGLPKQIVARVKELGHNACAVTDHGNVFAHVPFQKAATSEGIKPIFGQEFYVVDNVAERTRIQESLGASAFPHVTIIARTQQGYQNLLRLNRCAWDNFYYKPRIDWPSIIRYQEGLVVLSGCVGGYPCRLIHNRGPEAARDFIANLQQCIEHYYIELIPEPGLDISHETMPWLINIACELKIPMVMTADAHFPRREDHQLQDILLAVGTGQRVNTPSRVLQLPEYQFYCSEAELLQRAQQTYGGNYDTPESRWYTAMYRQAIANSDIIAAQCDVVIPQAKPVPYPRLDEGETAEQRLWRLVSCGFHQRNLDWQGEHAHYYRRACQEFEVLRRKGFCDYILAIADVVAFAKSQNSLVILRGSAGGCLLLWLMGTSCTDPIAHGLSFERFYDDSRPDPPDVDIDFERSFRFAAIEYIYSVYGADNCAQIAAVAQLKAKAAVQDVAAAFGIPRAEYAALSEALNSLDDDVEAQLDAVTDPRAIAVLKRYPELRLANGLIGQYRHASIHAAGVLVSSEPLGDTLGMVLGKDKQVVAAIDKKGAVQLGYLKMDFLGVNSLDIIGACVRQIGKPVSWLETIPLDDPDALAAAREIRLAGVFQLDGGSAARVSREIGLTSFADIVAASALCRPGPGDWLQIYKANKEQPERFAKYLAQLHSIAARVVTDTYGILLYQEQVMQLAREMACLDWPTVHKLRKGVQDKLGLDPQTGPEWRAEWSTKFVAGCVTNGVTQQEAEFWWSAIETHGGYSFNRAHCTSYGLVGYWMLYLKAHYSSEFYESYLQHEDDPVRMKRLIAEFCALGGKVELLDPVRGGATFRSVAPGVIAGGLSNIRGIGDKIAERALAKSPFACWEDLYEALPKAMAAKVKALRSGQEDQASQETVLAAPWFPVQRIGDAESALRNQYGFASLNQLGSESISGDTIVAGYVTATDFSPDRVGFMLEDEHKVIYCRVPNKALETAGPKFRELKVSDYIAAQGWWSGDRLYVREWIMLRRIIEEKQDKKGKK